MDNKRLAGVNARLARTRDEYRDALTAERKIEELGVRLKSARERTRRAAEQYQQALDEFIKKFGSKRSA